MNDHGDYNLWVEKYRPQNLNQIQGQESVKLLQSYLNSSIPHLLLYGPPGTGKTSAILAYCREYFQTDDYYFKVLELNASDERGIDTVRHKIKDFCMAPDWIHDGKPKIIILDEVDSMTNEAQCALKRIMEKYMTSTRFCLITNYLNTINDAIQSRCLKLKFNPLPIEQATRVLAKICQQEGLEYDFQALRLLVGLKNGDLRNAINTISIMNPNLYINIDIVKNQILIQKVRQYMVENQFLIFEKSDDQILEFYMQHSKEIKINYNLNMNCEEMISIFKNYYPQINHDELIHCIKLNFESILKGQTFIIKDPKVSITKEWVLASEDIISWARLKEFFTFLITPGFNVHQFSDIIVNTFFLNLLAWMVTCSDLKNKCELLDDLSNFYPSEVTFQDVLRLKCMFRKVLNE